MYNRYVKFKQKSSIMTFMMEISTGNFHLGFGIGTIISVDRVIALFNNLFMEKMNKAVFDYFKQ